MLSYISTPLLLLSTLLLTAPTHAAPLNASTQASPLNIPTLIAELLPGITTAPSPSQSAYLSSALPAYLSAFTATRPPSALEPDIAANILFATSTPSAGQISSIEAAVAGAETGLLNDPNGFVSKVNAMLEPFGGAPSAVLAYESAAVDGMKTMLASALSVSVPTQAASATASGSVQTGEGARGNTVKVGAVMMVAGAVGLGLL